MKFDLNMRNLINIGVFSAIYFAIVYACGFIGFGGPLFVVLAYLLAAVLNGPIMMYFMVKTPTTGALTIFGIINGILFVVAGFPWHVGVGIVVLSVIADGIASTGRYRNSWRNVLAYAVFSIWFVVPFLPILINPDAYFQEVATKFNSPEYAKMMEAFYTPMVMYGWIIGEFLLGAIGGWFGTTIMKKHFSAIDANQ